MKQEMASIKNQETNKKYYVQLESNPRLTANNVGLAIVTIMSDVLNGFKESITKVKSDISNQKGGNPNTTNTEDMKNISAEQLKQQADNLNNVIKKAQDKIEQLKSDITTNSYGEQNQDANTYDEVMSKSKEMGIAAFKTGVKWGEEIINNMIDFGMATMGETNILDTPLDQLSPELNKKLLLIAGVLKELSDNPATREAIKEIAKAIGTTVIEIMKEIKPELDKITDEALEMVDKVAEKSARGATATGISVSQAFLAEVPFVGGVIDLMIAIGKGFNAFMEVYKTFVEKGGQATVTTAKAIKGTEDTVNQGINRIETAVNNATTTLKNAQQQQPNILPNNNEMKGGTKEYIPNNILRNKIIKGGRRINKTMKLFHNTLPKIKYTFKQHIKKKNGKTKKRKLTRKV